MRVVLDTNVLVAGLRSTTGASRELIRLLLNKRLQVSATVAMMLEYESVLKREENLIASNLTINKVDEFLDGVSSVLTPVESHFRWRPQLRDPADEHVLEAAINGDVELIVTFNIKDFNPASRFGIEVVRPNEALRRFRHGNSK